jgi:hypothetical protein
MNKRVKKQHYISRTYLQEFSTPSKSKDLLWVRDNRGRWRPSRPENEGFENDFQSLIDENGNKSDELESYFAPYEGEFKMMLRQIEKTQRVPQGPEQLGTLLSIMGLFAIRVPTVRENFKRFATAGMKKTMGLVLQDERTYKAHMKKVCDPGEEPVPYQQMLDFHQSDAFTLKHDPMWVLETILKNVATVTDLLHLRNWMVVEAPAPLLITSSKPVNPFWTISLPPHEQGKGPLFYPESLANTHPTIVPLYSRYNEVSGRFPVVLPGFRIPTSMVVFPLTPSLALIGSWSPLPLYAKIDYCTAQAINWVTANSGADYVYSPQKLFSIPWNSNLAPYLQDYHNQLGSRLITFKP